jgi:hypothetical protein
MKTMLCPRTSAAAWILLAFLGLPARSPAETIRLYYDPATPQIDFAAGDIKAAVAARGFTVEAWDLAKLTDGHAGKKVVITLSADHQVKALLAAQGGKAVGPLAEQAYALRTTTASGQSYWIVGGDRNGAMYGGLQIAEYITFSGFSGTYDEEESPHLKSRGIKFNIPFDEKAPTYFSNHGGTSHREAIRHVWDMSFWVTWFDEMARHRYNALSLWSPHPYTSMLNMPDYPDVAIQGVQGFDDKGNKVKINDMTIDEKIAFWKKVMKQGRDRGFDIYVLTWNLFLFNAEGKYGLTSKPDNKRTTAYLKKCMIEFLKTYPDLAGFGVTVGERMGEYKDDDEKKEQWAWDAYGEGMMEYAQANPGRKLVFIHRHHMGDSEQILKYFSPLQKLPNVRLDLSFKYSQGHAHAAVRPGYWEKKGMSETLEKSGLKSWLTVRNDDFYFLHWADPQFVRDYVNGFPGVGTCVDAFYVGPDGWVFTSNFACKDPCFRNEKRLSIQKTWYMQKLWGRISYNPAVPDAHFKNHLSHRYPQASVEDLFQAWSCASRAVQLVNEQVTGLWDLDYEWWPEGWSSRDGFISLQQTRSAKPPPGSRISSISDTARGQHGGKISALANADTIEQNAREALRRIAVIDCGDHVELKLNLKDLEAMANLGHYGAHKIRAAVYLEQDRKTEAKQAIHKAYRHWRIYTDIMDSLYGGADLQRNKSVPHWHAHDECAWKDYTDMGGTGDPDRTAIEKSN